METCKAKQAQLCKCLSAVNVDKFLVIKSYKSKDQDRLKRHVTSLNVIKT